MKILITGGAGYVGSTLIPMLLERGHELVVFDRLMFGGNALLPFLNNKNFKFIKGDIRDREALQSVVSGQDVIIHLAAIVGFPACRENPDLARTTNVEGSRNLASVVSKDQRIIYASTGSNYGALVDEVCTEDSLLNPLSIYGKTKTEAEKILMGSGNCTAFRFATAFGVSPRLRLDLLINEFVYQAVKQKYLVVYESHFMRTFIHVKDMARAFVFAIDNLEKTNGQTYNVGDDSLNFSKKEICDIIAEKTGALIHYADVGEDADKRNYIVSYKKINDAGFKTTISIEEGIVEMIKVATVVQVNNPYCNN